ncbi:Aspartate carbamoyltransferase, chloroplastic-like protein [Drosera capensis]
MLWEESSDLMEVASKCDAVYQTRIQREHFGERNDLYELDEITVDVDEDPRAAYFRQAKNGLYIRMPILKLLLLETDRVLDVLYLMFILSHAHQVLSFCCNGLFWRPHVVSSSTVTNREK